MIVSGPQGKIEGQLSCRDQNKTIGLLTVIRPNQARMSVVLIKYRVAVGPSIVYIMCNDYCLIVTLSSYLY